MVSQIERQPKLRWPVVDMDEQYDEQLAELTKLLVV
jgi:hypothetical protein